MNPRLAALFIFVLSAGSGLCRSLPQDL